jgi:hypothetical protein
VKVAQAFLPVNNAGQRFPQTGMSVSHFLQNRLFPHIPHPNGKSRINFIFWVLSSEPERYILSILTFHWYYRENIFDFPFFVYFSS